MKGIVLEKYDVIWKNPTYLNQIIMLMCLKIEKMQPDKTKAFHYV